MPRVIDAFPFSGFGAELDLLEIRLHEMSKVASLFAIIESGETMYGGTPKPYSLEANWDRFEEFHKRILYFKLPNLLPVLPCTLADDVQGVAAADIRSAGRAREAFQRNQLWPMLATRLLLKNDDVFVFSDLDEIPNAKTVDDHIPMLMGDGEILRLKQRSFYYNVNCLIDYGRDICSRARMGTYQNLQDAGSFQGFRMFGAKGPIQAIEHGGWHMSFFGTPSQIREKVQINAPGLNEYKDFGVDQLVDDIRARKDLLHRHPNFSQLPETFQFVEDDDLPAYYLDHKGRFSHFSFDFFREG